MYDELARGRQSQLHIERPPFQLLRHLLHASVVSDQSVQLVEVEVSLSERWTVSVCDT